MRNKQVKKLTSELKRINAKNSGSYWRRGVGLYAEELIENIKQHHHTEPIHNKNILNKQMLNGASNWLEYSQGGCTFVYAEDICKRLATPSEQKKKKQGRLNPNQNEDWLDVQARALKQASYRVIKAYNNINKV